MFSKTLTLTLATFFFFKAESTSPHSMLAWSGTRTGLKSLMKKKNAVLFIKTTYYDLIKFFYFRATYKEIIGCFKLLQSLDLCKEHTSLYLTY